MNTEKVVKVVGVLASVIGVGASLAASWVTDKKMESTIAKKVAEAVTKESE